jgi:hypothetical protein
MATITEAIRKGNLRLFFSSLGYVIMNRLILLGKKVFFPYLSISKFILFNHSLIKGVSFD